MFIPNPSCFLVLCLSRYSPGVKEAGVKEVRQAPGSCASSQGRLLLAQPPARIAFPALKFQFPAGSGGRAGTRFPHPEPLLCFPRSPELLRDIREGNCRAQLNATRCEKLETAASCPRGSGGSQGHGGAVSRRSPGNQRLPSSLPWASPAKM